MTVQVSMNLVASFTIVLVGRLMLYVQTRCGVEISHVTN